MGVVVGLLTAQHVDHITLGNTRPMALRKGLLLEIFGQGTPVTVTFSYDDAGTIVVENVRRSEWRRLPG